MVRGEKPEAEASQVCRSECPVISGKGDLEICCVPQITLIIVVLVK